MNLNYTENKTNAINWIQAPFSQLFVTLFFERKRNFVNLIVLLISKSNKHSMMSWKKLRKMQDKWKKRFGHKMIL